MNNCWRCLVAASLSLALWRTGRREVREFVLVSDAGSSGTRFYLFPKGAAAGGDSFPSSPLLKLTDASLSDQTPETAFAYARPGLDRALAAVPDGATIEWHVYGTAGMRGLDPSAQEGLYAALAEGAAAWDPTGPSSGGGLRGAAAAGGAFPAKKRLIAGEMRTLEGDEEGYLAALAVNYLGGKLDGDLRPIDADGRTARDGLYGALDLGGSSAQVVYALDEDSDDESAVEARPLSKEDLFIHSYSDYGVNAMWNLLSNALAERRPGRPHPCLFKGEAIEIDGRSWEGEGHHGRRGGGCVAFIRSFLDEHNRDCARTNRNDAWCGLDNVLQPKPPRRTEYYAFGVYHYATGFARDVTSHYASETAGVAPLTLPSPSLGELKTATQTICDMEAEKVRLETFIDEWTTKEQVYRRCFDLSYIYVLLSRLGVDRVHFVDKLNGHKVSWTIGAYLLVLAREASQNDQSSYLERGWEASTHWIGYVCACALLLLGVIRGRRRIRSWYRSLRAPKNEND